MALNGNALGTAIFNALKNQLGWTPPNADDAQALAVWQAIASAIVQHIQTNGMVTGQATGVMSGGAVAPVTGTIS
jgi:hypothetical protein